jgi:hypothetical protein
MILFKISKETPEQLALLEIIQSMSLAHEVEHIQPFDLPVMIAYGKKHEGIDSIKEGISEVEKLVESWYECRCDKYEFE